MAQPTTLAALLAERTRDADPALGRPVDGAPGTFQCAACAHRCRIAPGRSGVCKVRFSNGTALRVPWGYVAALACDPIEKKPFFHVDPGGLALSFGMLGCSFRCAFCQNWETSQVVRDPGAPGQFRDATPDEIVGAALRLGAGSVVSTYNEPLITSEWAVEIFRLARSRGLRTGYVSNGHATPEVLEFLAPVIDCFKVDLKSFDEAEYRKLGGRLAAVLETIEGLVRRGIWCEVVTLLVPGLNDSDDELGRMARWLATLSLDIPWHCTAFHGDYQMEGSRDTAAADLLRAWRIGRDAGLRHVYVGNRPGELPGKEDTVCPGCGALLLRRTGFRVLDLRIGADGSCPDCGAVVPGRWGRTTTAKANGAGSPPSGRQ